ncbi:MAG: hypothetical protein O9345_02180 [Burkholderiaceae bacterium]|nr:hypothetical protein [Burkholderiales bacterium]MCZ8336959.1 hypothetical protein [Burkholderiaceae bacterium]
MSTGSANNPGSCSSSAVGFAVGRLALVLIPCGLVSAARAAGDRAVPRHARNAARRVAHRAVWLPWAPFMACTPA